MTNRPLSTALQHRIASNIVDIYERGDCVALPLRVSGTSLTSGAGDRPWTSVDWACAWVCPMQVGRNIAELKAHFLARVWNEYDDGAADPAVELELRVEGEGANRLTISEATARYRPYSITLGLTNREPREIQVSLWVRNVPEFFGGTATVANIIGRFRSVLETDTGTPYADGTDPQPATDSPDLFATSPNDADEQYEFFDHIRADNVSKATDRRMAVYPDAYTWTAGDNGKLRALSYAQVRCITLQTSYDGAGLYNAFELRANVVETSEIAQKHLRLQDEIYTRPSLLSIGLDGETNWAGGGAWPAGYREGWVWTAGSSADTILHSAIAPVDANARITARLLLVGIHTVIQPSTSPNDFDSLRNTAAQANWNIRVDVRQSSTVLDDVTLSVPVTHYVTDFRLNSRFCFQQYWARYVEGAFGYSFVYREGLLYAEDFALVTPVVLSINPAGLNYDEPVIFDVWAERDTSVTPIYSDGTTSERAPASLRLFLVGGSIQRERIL
jgi:hypothetical protein